MFILNKCKFSYNLSRRKQNNRIFLNNISSDFQISYQICSIKILKFYIIINYFSNILKSTYIIIYCKIPKPHWFLIRFIGILIYSSVTDVQQLASLSCEIKLRCVLLESRIDRGINIRGKIYRCMQKITVCKKEREKNRGDRNGEFRLHCHMCNASCKANGESASCLDALPLSEVNCVYCSATDYRRRLSVTTGT